MPRIRNWKDLHFYRPHEDSRYEHIDALFDKQINWDLIEAMLPDMLRVALSVKAGNITPSAILRMARSLQSQKQVVFRLS